MTDNTSAMPDPAMPSASAQPGAGQEQFAAPPQQQPWAAAQPGQQVQQWAQQPGQPMQQAVAPKNPAVSLLISFFIPGLGSIISGNTNTGIIILVVWVVGWFLSWLLLVGIPVVIGAWIWGMIDAYQSAQKWNAQHGIIS